MAFDINSTPPENVYTVTAPQTAFDVTFGFFADSDLLVYDNNAIKTLTTDYTVTGAGVTGGGTVTFLTGRTAGHVIRIRRETPKLRVSSYVTGGGLTATALESDLDRGVCQTQELDLDAARNIGIADSEYFDTSGLRLPVAATRANSYLTFDASGNVAMATAQTTTTLTQVNIGTTLYPITPAETAAAVTPLFFYYPPGNVLRYKANAIPGTTDMASAFQAASNQMVSTAVGAAPVYAPGGTYLVASTVTFTPAADNQGALVYGDGWRTRINSTVVGAPTFKGINCKQIIFEKMRFVGNGLTGVTGNGHGIALTSPSYAGSSGPFYPQHSVVRDCKFAGFAGDDLKVTGAPGTITTPSAAVYIGPGIASHVIRCVVDSGQVGIMLDRSSNSHVHECVVAITLSWGVMLNICTDGCSVTCCDIINNGKLTIAGADNEDPVISSGTLYLAAIYANTCEGEVLIERNKFKNGQAITAFTSSDVIIRHNNIRVDGAVAAGAAIFGMQIRNCDRVVIDANKIQYHTNTALPGILRKGIDLQFTSAAVKINYCITNNRFVHEGGPVDSDINVVGSSSTLSRHIFKISGNSFGVLAPNFNYTDLLTVVTTCIRLATLRMDGAIECNTFHAPSTGAGAAVTLTACLTLSGASTAANTRMAIRNNESTATAPGVITTGIEGFQNDVVGVFAPADLTPDVTWKTTWETDTGGITITDFDNPIPGLNRVLTVISRGAVLFSNAGDLETGGGTPITTAAGDVTTWVLNADNTVWSLSSWVRASQVQLGT